MPMAAAGLVAARFIYTGETGKLTDELRYLADARATNYASMDYRVLKVEVFWRCGYRAR